MNRKGQFSIIAALLVSVVLIATVMSTYSIIINNTVQSLPLFQDAVQETNLAIKQILGFTVGYYGSVLTVSGNTSYARTLAVNYMQSGLANIARMHPEWATSINAANPDLSTYWFSNASYSKGKLTVAYNLTGLGITGVNLETSCKLSVSIMNATGNQAFLSVVKDENEPLISLGKQSFKFFRYENSTWNLVAPSIDPIAYANGTYQMDTPTGVDPNSYVVQVEDQRGIIVVASAFTLYTYNLTWPSIPPIRATHYYPNGTSNVDSSPDKGTHSNFTAQQYADSIYDTLTEGGSSTTSPYYPSGYNLLGSTQYTSGSLSDLQSDNGVYMTFRSYDSSGGGNASVQTLYAHNETTTVGGSAYYLSKNSSADVSGKTLSVSCGNTTGRKLIGKFVYQLTGVSSIPASTWATYYRAYTDSSSNTHSFRASGGYMRVGDGTPNWGSATGTISFWVKWNTVSGRPWGQHENMETRMSGSRLVLDWGGSTSLTSTRSFVAGTWYFIAIVWNQNTDGLYLYVGDQSNSPTLDAQVTWTGSVSPVGVTQNNFMASKSGVEPLNGYGDELRYWNTDRGLASIQSDYKTELAGSEANLRSYFKLNNDFADSGPAHSDGSGSGSYSFSTDVPFTTSSTVHGDVDILIRTSSGSVRQTIATDVANSGNLGGSWSTLSGTYSWSNYTVVDQTDYLEIDYYMHVTSAGGGTAYLRIDDNTLALANQTRATNISFVGLPTSSTYTSEVEFTGNSTTGSWAQLIWTIDSKFTIDSVDVTFQLFNYNASAYPTSGDGFMNALIGTSNVTQAQIITANPTYFRDTNGNWKLKVKGVRATTSQFNWTVDFVRYQVTSSDNYELDLEEQWTNVNYTNPDEKYLCIKSFNTTPTENLQVDYWNGTTWQNLFTNIASGWNNATVSPYVTTSNFTVRFKGSNETSDTTQDNWLIDAALLRFGSDIQLSSTRDTIAIELLQNGTMRWLGQSLQQNQTNPIPPLPTKSIRVNQTINNVNCEVPFQIEDWASDYMIPLGLTSNSSVFSDRTMLVFLANSNVSKVAIYWNGSDQITQTPYAYVNQYFTGDDPSTGKLTNGKVTLQFGSSFTLNSTVGTSTCKATFMRMNSQPSSYGSGVAYAITSGIVRDVVHQEAEWSGGVTNCPDFYAHIVLTLPANVTYYTYQLRLMFVDSKQNRSITDMCPIKLETSINQIQTENGTANGYPVVSASSALFYNLSSVWSHHWSQFISGTKGAGIMFTDDANRKLYIFDNSTTKTGGLKPNSTARTIELLPVAIAPANFTYALDITWFGAVSTFDNTTPIYQQIDAETGGSWINVEYPPTAELNI
jgi:hypothetical protein